MSFKSSLSNINLHSIEKDDSRNILDSNGDVLKRINDSCYSTNIKPKPKKNERVIECDYCEKTFATRHGHSIHMSRVHKTQWVNKIFYNKNIFMS